MWTYDIEVLVNCFLVCFKNRDTGEWRTFILWKDIDEIDEMIDFIKYEVKGLISFNGLNYDSQVIQFIINWQRKNSRYGSRITVDDIYDCSQQTIERSNMGEWPVYPEWKLSWAEMDLMRVWHYDNRARATSLKWIQYSIDWPDLRDMPIEHYEPIETREQLDELIYYCKNDVSSTEAFYWISKGETDHPEYKGVDKIQLRKDIQKEFKIKCRNYSDVKIGEEIIKQSYCNATGIEKKYLKDIPKTTPSFTFGDCLPDYIDFETDIFRRFADTVSEEKVRLRSKNQEYVLKVNPYLTLTVARGGIHSVDPRRIFRETPGMIIRDADVGSQYPNGIRKRKIHPRHLEPVWLANYTDIIQKRLEAKKSGKKAVNQALKLSLNGGSFGKMGEERSWQYDAFSMCKVTIGNQFEILMLIEQMELAGITVFSANTDGITAFFPKEKEERYYEICDWWEKKVGNEDMGKLEFVDYKLFAQMSVNHYLAVKSDGKPKTKGEFAYDVEIHKNKSGRIIPLTLVKHLMEGVDVTEMIKSHDNIYDFCFGVRARGGDEIWSIDRETGEQVKQQKTVRYYISNASTSLVKRMKPLENKVPTMQIDMFTDEVDDGTRQNKINAGYCQTVFNQYEEGPYDINYDFYIDAVLEKLKMMEEIPINQLKLE